MIHKAVIVNHANPELNYLAAALARQGLLYQYIRPYMFQNRSWEKGLGLLLTKDAQLTTIQRRTMPDGLNGLNTRETAVLEDYAMAISERLGESLPRLLPLTGKLTNQIIQTIYRRLEQASAQYATEAEYIVANQRLARAAFLATHGKRIVNASSVPYQYWKNFVKKEAALQPDFSTTLPVLSWNEKILDQLDEELALAERILVGSSFVRHTYLLNKIPAEKIRVIPYGADLSLFTPPQTTNEDERKFKIIYAGRLGQAKGISYLLHAYQKFQGPGIELTLAGNFVNTAEPFVPWRHLFQHAGHLTRPQLAEHFRRAQVFVFPSLVEGMGLVVLEAMASGLPVITTPNGPGDIVRDGVDGFIVPPRNVNAIVEKLEYLRTHPQERAQMGQNARVRSLLFSWENYCKAALVAIFEGVQIHPWQNYGVIS